MEDHPGNAGICGGGWQSCEALELILRRGPHFCFVSPRWLPFVFVFFVWREATDEPREETRTEPLEERPADEDAAAAAAAAALWERQRSPSRALSLRHSASRHSESCWPCISLFIYSRSASPTPTLPRFPDARPGRGKPKCAPDIGKPILLSDAVVIKDYYPDCLHGQERERERRVESERDPAWEAREDRGDERLRAVSAGMRKRG